MLLLERTGPLRRAARKAEEERAATSTVERDAGKEGATGETAAGGVTWSIEEGEEAAGVEHLEVRCFDDLQK